MRTRGLVALAAAIAALTACTPDQPAHTAAPATAPSVSAAPPAAPDESCGPRRSLRPSGALPAPGHMPAGSYMAAIRKRGRLILGTSEDTLLFSSRNPFTGRIEGFDVDMGRQVAKAIFGDPDKIQIKVIPYAARVADTADGTVDLVADTMTINCERWAKVAFSTVYYDAGQRLLVSNKSRATSLAGLAGKRVCAALGSTSLTNIATHAAQDRVTPPPVPVGLPTFGDCLVAFQRNEVDAVSTDDTILAGLAAQDPYAEVVGGRFTSEPYGMAISQQHPEFVRFVNAVLDRMRADGTWQATYRTWLGRFGPPPRPPAAEYRD
jgi:polar amino acid transport system substrate-binding protein